MTEAWNRDVPEGIAPVVDLSTKREVPRANDHAYVPCRWSMVNRWRGGNQDREVDQRAVEKLTAILPSIADAVIDGAAFVERATRWAVSRQGIRRLLVLGIDIPTRNEPFYAEGWRAAGLRLDEGRVMYVDDDPVPAAIMRGYFGHTGVDVVEGDPADPTGIGQVVQTMLDPLSDEPVVTVIPDGLLHRLGDGEAATLLGDIRLSSPKGSYLVATHALDPGTEEGTAVARRLAAVVVNEPCIGPAHFRTTAEIMDLMPGVDRIAGVSPARDWYPDGPSLWQPRPLASELIAGIVAVL